MKFLLIAILHANGNHVFAVDHIYFDKLSDCNRAAAFYVKSADNNYSTADVTCMAVSKEASK